MRWRLKSRWASEARQGKCHRRMARAALKAKPEGGEAAGAAQAGRWLGGGGALAGRWRVRGCTLVAQARGSGAQRVAALQRPPCAKLRGAGGAALASACPLGTATSPARWAVHAARAGVVIISRLQPWRHALRTRRARCPARQPGSVV